MLGLGLRLAVAGGTRGGVRLLATVVGAALGCAMLFIATGLEPALQARSERIAQRAEEPVRAGLSTISPAEPGPGPGMLLLATTHHVADQVVTVVDVASTGGTPPTPPGLVAVPEPGMAAVSPGVVDLASDLGGLIRDGSIAGSIGPSGLADPSELLIWRGRAVDELRATARGVVVVRAFPLPAPDARWWANALPRRVGIAAAIVVLVAPLIVFVAVMFRLGALQRERRQAALSLAGATTRQMAMISATEGALLGLLAAVLGYPVSVLARRAIAHLRIGGHAWFPGDFAPSLGLALTVSLFASLAAVLASLLGLRRVESSPLGVASRAATTRMSTWRSAAPVPGLALVAAAAIGGDRLSPVALAAFTTLGCAAIMFGLPASATLLMRALSNRVAATARYGWVLVASRRTGNDPATAFRACSGIVLAVFGLALVQGYVGGNLGQRFDVEFPAAVDGVVDTTGADAEPVASLIRELEGMEGVAGLAVVQRVRTRQGDPVVLVDCEAMNSVGVAVFEPCPSHAWVSSGLEPPENLTLQPTGHLVEPASYGTMRSNPTSGLLALGTDLALSIDAVPKAVTAEGEPGFIALATRGEVPDNVVTAVSRTLPGRELVTAASRNRAINAGLLEARRIVLLLSSVILAIGLISVVSNTIGSFLVERGTVTHLRRVGLSRRQLLATALTQSALALVVAVPLALGAGLITALGFIEAVGGRFAPSMSVLASVGVLAIVAPVAAVAAGFPILDRSTRPRSPNDE